MNRSRRRFLLGGIAAGLSLAERTVFAKAPMAGIQVSSVHRMKLGNFEVTTLLDGYVDSDPKLMAADPELIATLLEAAHLPNGPIRLSVNAFLINTGEKLVLIDSGAAKLMGPNLGRLPESFATAGVDRAQVDEVLITHMHGDHIGGVVTSQGNLLCPNAQLRMAKADYDFWTSAENEAKEKPERKLRFVASKRAVGAYGDRVKPFNPGEEIVPGIRSIAAVGHTPGHTCYMIQSSNARMLAIGDLLHIRPVQFSRPEVTIAYDSDQADCFGYGSAREPDHRRRAPALPRAWLRAEKRRVLRIRSSALAALLGVRWVWEFGIRVRLDRRERLKNAATSR